ncbi:MAG: AraC family transcriptional regulator [Verrucomicrobiota bacterium]|nr:AraC family transcriptional regulator [Verrucomicrobiota bacterium]
MELPPGFINAFTPWPAWETPLGRLGFAGTLHDTQGTGLTRFRVFGMYALVLLVDGAGRYRDTLGTDRRLAPGDCILVFPELGHQYGPEPEDTWSEAYLCFQGDAFAAWRHTGGLSPHAPVISLRSVSDWYPRWRALAENHPRHPAEAIALLSQIHTLIADLLAQHSQPASGDGWLEFSCRELQGLPPGKPVDWAKLARACGLSYENWRKRFRQATGQSPLAYRRHALLQRAAELLTRADLTNDQLASQFGFCDGFHFSKAFKSIHGVSPQSYRRQLHV